MNNIVLSIIVPVYKVEPYINHCLDSLIVSPDLMERLEIIIVNDGTPDRSADMSREYVKRFPDTFHQIDKENAGHGSAWNIGLKAATGKYVKFLDSDDWLSNLDRLVEFLSWNDVDIVFNPYVKEYATEHRSEVISDTSFGKLISPIEPAQWGSGHSGFNSVNFWSITYRTEILHPLSPLFAEKVMFDDYILTWAPLVYGRTVIALDFPVYHYFIGRPGQSMSSTHQQKGAYSYVKCFDQYERVRSRLDEASIPPAFLKKIDESIGTYAGFVFSFLIYLPYREAELQMRRLWGDYVQKLNTKTKLQKRFAALPFCIFFPIEHLRRRINTKKHIHG